MNTSVRAGRKKMVYKLSWVSVTLATKPMPPEIQRTPTQQLKNQNIFSKNTNFLYLNSLELNAGSILFGVVDHAKYEGDLKYLDIVNIGDSDSYPALLNSGATLVYAPTAIAGPFGKMYGHKIPFVNTYFANCDTKDEDFEFNFSDKTIKIPFKNLLCHTNGLLGLPFLNQCLVGVTPYSADYNILGDTLEIFLCSL